MTTWQLKILEKAIEKDDLLTSWEHDFIMSLDSMPQYQDLTERQNHQLNKISQKIYD